MDKKDISANEMTLEDWVGRHREQGGEGKYLFKGNETSILERDLHSQVHYSIIHNSQNIETT